MKNFLFTSLGMLWMIAVQAQPRPFEPDPSFVPSFDFMQKSWSGEYDGLEPNSKMIISISRTLVLNKDLTYTNEVKGHIKEQTEEVLLRYEKGTYQFNTDNRIITYSIDMDSTLDINILLKGEDLSYTVNHYLEKGTMKTSTEEALFTRAASDNDRQWILFDSQLMSPIDPRQKAVYTMNGKEIETSGISILSLNIKRTMDSFYNLNGNVIKHPTRGLYIFNRKKIIVK